MERYVIFLLVVLLSVMGKNEIDQSFYEFNSTVILLTERGNSEKDERGGGFQVYMVHFNSLLELYRGLSNQKHHKHTRLARNEKQIQVT